MKIKKSCCVASLMALMGLYGFSQKEITAPTSTLKDLTAKIQAIFEGSSLPGFSVILVNDKKVLYQQSMGYADVNTKMEFDSHTVQNIASVSKTFIGVALMKAVEEGHLDLDTDINIYLPFKVVHPLFPHIPITLRQLATHTSGINDERTYGRCYVLQHPEIDDSHLPKKIRKYISLMRKNAIIDDSEFLNRALEVKGEWYSKKNFSRKKPGSHYQYSNIGAALAAFVLESAVGMPYEEYTKKHIFDPLQMSETTWDLSTSDTLRFATRYLKKEMVMPDYLLVTKADGGLVTNTTDFGKFLIEMVKGFNGEGTLLSSASYQEMFRREQFGKESSGIFWGVSQSGKPNHSGSDPGVLTNTAINPNRNLAVFFMTNIGIELNKAPIKTLFDIRNILKAHSW